MFDEGPGERRACCACVSAGHWFALIAQHEVGGQQADRVHCGDVSEGAQQLPANTAVGAARHATKNAVSARRII
jgi:hypothetical protein